MSDSARKIKPLDVGPVCMGLTIGSYVHVALEGIGSCRGLFVGMEQGQYLLVKLPMLAGIGNKLYKKNHIIIRYVHGGNIYGFRSTLIGLIRESIRLVIFAYPKMVESINLRKEERFICILPASMHFAGDLEERDGLAGFISDLSSGGCSFEISLPVNADFPELKIGALVRLSFSLHDVSPEIVVEAESRTIHKDKSRVRLGLKFRIDFHNEAHQHAREAIHLFIADLKKNSIISNRGPAL